ncbi:MAG: AGE family epimerase/isomerase, partial [Paramuribaculum sp.]|nr:AGE family epimerase/isomerase [Paramuribaculum sp.]
SWEPIADMRLSDKDDNASKTMNTHLHIIEPYTNLLRVWRSPELLEATRSLLELFLNRIADPAGNGHLGLFFDNEWNRRDGIISYGHDIEASWLLL